MPHLLIVDDSAADRRLVRELLSQGSDWRVSESPDGQDALERMAESDAEGQSIDLVLTDLQMPRMDGLELVRRVRAERPGIPVILMTAVGSEETAVRAIQSGAAHYVPKRNLAQDLAEITRRILEVAGNEKSLLRLMTHRTRSECRFELPNDLDMIGSLVQFLKQEASRVGLCDETEQFRLAIALEEALLNSYYHGNLEVSSALREGDGHAFRRQADERRAREPYSRRRIHVDVSLSPDEGRFVIRDEGPGFDPAGLPDPTDPENLLRPSGRGIFLMRAFVDMLEFNRSGNQVTMVKRRNSHPVPS
ncbi:MAG: response regulator [Planctomycetes bacterium]|nr:response regulator [Planctomycetota bacterium]